MPHGGPDYGVGAPKATVYSLQDMAELAVRLGSIVSFDRRGDVVWLDDFESGIKKWEINASDADSGVAISSDYCNRGANSAKVYASAGVDRWAAMAHYFALPVKSKVGFEVAFTIYPPDVHLNFILYPYFDPTREYYEVRHDRTLKILQYYGSDGTRHTFATGVNLYGRDYHFNQAKLVIDLATKKYVRFLLNDVTYDLSAYAPPSWSYSGAAFVYAGIRMINQTANARTIYVDDAIVTQNEP